MFGSRDQALPDLHLLMKDLRGLPWTLAASAFFEHSSDWAVRGFSVFFIGMVVAGAVSGAAGAAV